MFRNTGTVLQNSVCVVDSVIALSVMQFSSKLEQLEKLELPSFCIKTPPHCTWLLWLHKSFRKYSLTLIDATQDLTFRNWT